MQQFEAFLIKKDALRQNHNDSRPAELYNTAKEWVKHLPMMLAAVNHFEMVNPLVADQTYEAIIEHLTNFAESNASAITAHHAINEMKEISSKTQESTIATAVANEVRKQFESKYPRKEANHSQHTTTAIAKMIRSETSIEDAVMKRLIKNVTTFLQQESGQEVKNCKHHPHSTSHNTSECAIETGVQRPNNQRKTAP